MSKGQNSRGFSNAVASRSLAGPDSFRPWLTFAFFSLADLGALAIGFAKRKLGEDSAPLAVLSVFAYFGD